MSATLRGLTTLNADLRTNVNRDVFAACAGLMLRDRYFICENALIQAGRRKDRNEVQWDVQRAWLEERFHCKLTAHTRAALRNMTIRKIDPLKVTKEVAKALVPGLNGNQTAGFSFTDWDRPTTERQIATRYHTAEAFEESAERLHADLNRPPLLE